MTATVDSTRPAAPATRSNAYLLGRKVLVIDLDQDDPDLWELDAQPHDGTTVSARAALQARGWVLGDRWHTSPLDGTVWTTATRAG